jgi:hypothetical protein
MKTTKCIRPTEHHFSKDFPPEWKENCQKLKRGLCTECGGMFLYSGRLPRKHKCCKDLTGVHMGKKTKSSAKLEISMSELSSKRYGLILKGVLIGLKEVGIRDVFIPMPKVEGDRFVFNVEREIQETQLDV